MFTVGKDVLPWFALGEALSTYRRQLRSVPTYTPHMAQVITRANFGASVPEKLYMTLGCVKLACFGSQGPLYKNRMRA